MASKRRAAAAKNAEELRLKSPTMRRSRRKAAAAAEATQEGKGGEAAGEAPASPRGPPETNSYKTPKRTRASRSRMPTFSSPANETDVQQEIFWDPQSPITYKLGNEQKKQTVNGHTVEISEIVNRIAPQDEKPACHEGNLLGFWIGDDAIPCTPAITKGRLRRKVNGVRGRQSKHREEELMELAKQFDKNLTDAIQDQNSSVHTITHFTSEAERSTEHEDEPGMQNQQGFLEENPKANPTFGTVGRSTKALEPCEDSRQEPLNLDAEIALNELFDGPTQKCSGRLSQGLSDCSSNSSFHENQNMLLEEDNITAASKQTIGEAHLREGIAVLLTECVATALAPNSKGSSGQTAPKISSCTTGSIVSSNVDRIANDDFDDWGDDSFLMQITQNPELIQESPSSHVSDKNMEQKESSVVSAQSALFHSFKNDPTLSALQKYRDTGNTERVLPHSNLTIKTEKTKFISTSGDNKITCHNPLPVKPGTKSKQEGFTQLKCPDSGSFPEKRSLSVSEPSALPKPQVEKYESSISNTNHQSSFVCFSMKALNITKASGPDSACHLKQKELPKNSAFAFENWDEPKFSDEVLDLFCESDSLWDTNGDDDDDLLCQVCDDVEKNTLSQKVVKEKENATPTLGNPSKLEVSSCLTGANQAISNCPLVQKGHMGRKTFSLGTPVKIATLPKNENCRNPVQTNWQAFKTESTNCIQGKWSRSHSAPGGDFSSGSSSAAPSNGYLNDSNVQWQKGLSNIGRVPNNSNINQLPTEKSKYVFRKTNPSQTLALDYRSVNVGQTLKIIPGFGENKNAPNIQFQTANQTNTKLPFKRHLSDCLTQYETEQKSTKCSQEEIARKKQEALERRKCKMQALLKNTAPT
ncbi:ewing's tumor-associated antigen 1 isoform X1 [Anolis carolinensis]|uniref:ewing's tumor-associated antigen 1 isoform X1 n=1 Tax=Anolis carolinensis TaxID=28377 RepID=UPI002F2B4649